MTTTSDPFAISVAGRVNGKPTPILTPTQQNTATPFSDGAKAPAKPAIANSAVISRPGISATRKHSLHQVVLLNKYLNDSGQPNRYRVAPNSNEQFIQEINPATGEVIGEFPATKFPTLAKSLGLVGTLIDSRA